MRRLILPREKLRARAEQTQHDRPILLLLLIPTVCLVWLVRQYRARPASPIPHPSSLDLAAFAVAWCYIGLLPMIGIVKVGYEPHSDRYTYWIGCGFVCCAALALRRLQPSVKRRAKPIAAASAALIALLAALSLRQGLVWRDNTALLTSIYEKTRNESAALSLCEDLLAKNDAKDRAKAEAMLRETLRIRKSSRAKAALALLLLDYGRSVAPTDEARRLAEEALKEDGKNSWAFAAQAFIDRHDKDYASACENMKRARSLGFKSLLANFDPRDWERSCD